MNIFSDDVGMVVGLDKCVVLVLKRLKVVRTEGIKVLDRKRMREVKLDEWKYLGVLQLYSTMNRDVKERVKSE